MDAADAEDQAVLAKLDRLNALVFARDPALVDELWSDLGFRLVGSEGGRLTRHVKSLQRIWRPCSPSRSESPGHGDRGR
jgi:hypothetical protein